MRFKRATTDSSAINAVPNNQQVQVSNLATTNPPAQAPLPAAPPVRASTSSNTVTTTANPPDVPPASFVPQQASVSSNSVSITSELPKTDSAVSAPLTNSDAVSSDSKAAVAPNTSAEQQNNVPIIPNIVPLLVESPKGNDVVIKPASQVTVNDPTRTIEYFVSYGLTQTVLDDKTTSVYKTQTYAAIRPIATTASSAEFRFPFLLVFLLLFIFK